MNLLWKYVGFSFRIEVLWVLPIGLRSVPVVVDFSLRDPSGLSWIKIDLSKGLEFYLVRGRIRWLLILGYLCCSRGIRSRLHVLEVRLLNVCFITKFRLFFDGNCLPTRFFCFGGLTPIHRLTRFVFVTITNVPFRQLPYLQDPLTFLKAVWSLNWH